MIDFWESLWKLVFYIGVGLFGCMAVFVTIFGARDISKLFRTIKEGHAQQERREESDRD